MREIKFRAWQPCSEQNEAGDVIDCGFMETWEEMIEEGLELYFDGKTILMQFTGLLDRNGKEIYEGDVVKYNNAAKGRSNWSKPVEIVWRQDRAKFDFHTNHEDGWSFGGLIYEEYEIIGNIYENSELLK